MRLGLDFGPEPDWMKSTTSSTQRETTSKFVYGSTVDCFDSDERYGLRVGGEILAASS